MLQTPKLQYFKLAITRDARKPFQPLSKIFEKFSRDENIKATKGAEDPTIDCLKEKTPSWKDIDDVVDAYLHLHLHQSSGCLFTYLHLFTSPPAKYLNLVYNSKNQQQS